MSDRDIKEDVKIDRYALEEEASEHSSLYWYWSEQAVEFRKERDIARAKYKETVAQVELEYRSDAREMDCKKTESSISAAVETDPEVKKAKLIMIEAEYNLSKLESAEEAMRQRKSMLNNLIELYTKQYYSSPSQSDSSRTEQAGEDYRSNMKKNKEKK